MSIIERIRSVAAQRAAPTIEGVTRGVLPGLLGNTAAGAIVKGITQGRAGIASVIPDLKRSAPDLILGEVNRRSNAADAQAKRQADQLARQAAGKSNATGPTVVPGPAAFAPPSLYQPTPWAPAPLFGGLTLAQYRQLFADSAMTPKAWKNLFFVNIIEYTPSIESPGGAGGFNLFALDVSFAPNTAPGDAVAVGSANIDSLMSSERVELRISTLDDSRGSVKRWFMAKADQATHQDGTFGVPKDYLVVIEITHMAPTNVGEKDARLRHKFLMRPSNIEIELSRRAPELEELQMSFVQFDTFVVPQ